MEENNQALDFRFVLRIFLLAIFIYGNYRPVYNDIRLYRFDLFVFSFIILVVGIIIDFKTSGGTFDVIAFDGMVSITTFFLVLAVINDVRSSTVEYHLVFFLLVFYVIVSVVYWIRHIIDNLI